MYALLLVRGISILLVCAQIGCAEGPQKMQANWHQKFRWKAEDFFNTPNVVALCHAIEANDLNEIDRLIAAGADINAKGKGNMTPLLWAFPDNKLERFKKLLEHGADPNVIIESDFNTRGAISAGDSVTHLVCKTSFPAHFELVFNSKGDPNLLNAGPGKLNDSPLLLVIKFGSQKRKEKIRLLLDKGANLNHLNSASFTPTMQAVTWGGQFDIALMLLKRGANFQIYQENQAQKLTHVVARQKRRLSSYTPKQTADYEVLVKWLADHGESVDSARKDIERWDSWSSAEFPSKMDAEIAERKAGEAREKAAAEKAASKATDSPMK